MGGGGMLGMTCMNGQARRKDAGAEHLFQTVVFSKTPWVQRRALAVRGSQSG